MSPWTKPTRPAWMVHRGTRALLALCLLICVVAAEWWSQLDYSLGIFYLFSIVVLATVATRLQIVAAAVACASSAVRDATRSSSR